MIYDYLIVGAGFSGAVLAERIASQLNKKVLIIDKRNHIGGNCYDYKDENDVLVHKYGPHIFHTSSQKVLSYLSNFTDWHPYSHHVLAVIGDKKVPVPFNLNSLEQLFPKNYSEKLERILIEKYGFGNKIPILKLREAEEAELKELADYIYDNVFYGYTYKQWGFKPEELDFSVSSRVPVFISRDDRYFQDIHQVLPKDGYTALFEKLLNHKNINVLLQTDYISIINDVKFNKLIFTGPIDSFFDYMYGDLPYRSLNFDFQNIKQEYFQETSQVNYPNEHDYTRITEFKHFLNSKSENTTIAYEYPVAHIKGQTEPYYPIPREDNNLIYQKYKDEAKKIENNVIFTGRLAEYKYYNMDQVIGIALQVFEKNIANSQ